MNSYLNWTRRIFRLFRILSRVVYEIWFEPESSLSIRLYTISTGFNFSIVSFQFNNSIILIV